MLLAIAVLVVSFLTSTPHEVNASVFRAGSGYLEVADWSLVKNSLHTGDYILSEPFNVSGHEWVIKFYPQGYDGNFTKSLSVFVNLKTDNGEGKKGVRAYFAHSLFDWKAGNWSDPRTPNSNMETFYENKMTFAGYYYFLSHSALESSNYLGNGNDTLLLRTTLVVLQGDRTTTTGTTDASFDNYQLDYSLIKLQTDA